MTKEEGLAKVKRGDVIQLGPTVRPAFRYCFAIVDEVRSWGVQGPVMGPTDDEHGQGAEFWFRAEWSAFEYVGAAVFFPEGMKQ